MCSGSLAKNSVLSALLLLVTMPFPAAAAHAGSTKSAVASPVADPDFICKHCRSKMQLINICPLTKVVVGRFTTEVVASFCYLGDTFSSGCGCKHCQVISKKFHQLLPILTSCCFLAKTRCHEYIHDTMLHDSETGALLMVDFNCLCWNDRAVICWM